MIAQQVDMLPGELVWMGGDVHLYMNHAHLIEEQLARQPQGTRGSRSCGGRKQYSTTASRISRCMITRRSPDQRPRCGVSGKAPARLTAPGG